jgi:hypothetical protein
MMTPDMHNHARDINIPLRRDVLDNTANTVRAENTLLFIDRQYFPAKLETLVVLFRHRKRYRANVNNNPSESRQA